MVIGIIGENCAGKTTLAEEIGKVTGAEIVTGKDYLRMAKSASEAAELFRKKLENLFFRDALPLKAEFRKSARPIPYAERLNGEFHPIRESFQAPGEITDPEIYIYNINSYTFKYTYY